MKQFRLTVLVGNDETGYGGGAEDSDDEISHDDEGTDRSDNESEHTDFEGVSLGS